MEGVRQVPALFKAKVATEDDAVISMTTVFRYGYINKDDLPLVNRQTTRVYPTLNVARASCGPNASIIKVKVEIVNESN